MLGMAEENQATPAVAVQVPLTLKDVVDVVEEKVATGILAADDPDVVFLKSLGPHPSRPKPP